MLFENMDFKLYIPCILVGYSFFREKYTKMLITFISGVVLQVIFSFFYILIYFPMSYSNILTHFFWKNLNRRYHVKINFLAHFPCTNLWLMCYLLWRQQWRVDGTADKGGEITLICLVAIKMWLAIILYVYNHLFRQFYLLTSQF